MAELARPQLTWPADPEGTDPGVRVVELPVPLPKVGDDFDWQQRDFDSFRGAMWRELQDRFPERTRWTTGDVETVLIDVLAMALDQLSDMADRVSTEAYLVTARRVESVLGWLHFIGYDPTSERGLTVDQLLEMYRNKPHQLELDRQRGPASIRTQRRMVSLADYGARIEDHPLVERAYSQQRWNGSWFELTVTVSLAEGRMLDTELLQLSDRERTEVEGFHKKWGLRKLVPDWTQVETTRRLVTEYLKAFRMVGHMVELADIVQVGLVIELCIHLEDHYFHSEVRREVERVLGHGPTGFFRPGRLAAGQDIQKGDLYGALMPLDGIRSVDVLQFRKQPESPGEEIPDRIVLDRDELAVIRDQCGELIVHLQGGRRG